MATSFAERWVGTACREAFDHLLIFGRRHLERVLKELLEHHHEALPHKGLGQRRPGEPSGAVCQRTTYGQVECPDRLGGLLDEYVRAA